MKVSGGVGDGFMEGSVIDPNTENTWLARGPNRCGYLDLRPVLGNRDIGSWKPDNHRRRRRKPSEQILRIVRDRRPIRHARRKHIRRGLMGNRNLQTHKRHQLLLAGILRSGDAGQRLRIHCTPPRQRPLHTIHFGRNGEDHKSHVQPN